MNTGNMKYRVKFKCYWHNTGAADNHHYDNHEDFDTLEEAVKFQQRVNEQYAMSKKDIIYEWNKKELTEYQKTYKTTITKEEHDTWKKDFEHIEVENGYIDGAAKIVKYYPEREEDI